MELLEVIICTAMNVGKLWPSVIRQEPLDESQEVEFKSPQPWAEIEPGVVKTVLSLSNTENGGLIIVGVTDNDGQKTPVGIRGELIESYNVQTLGHKLASYGSDGLAVSVTIAKHSSREFVLIAVEPFGEYPIICARSVNPGTRGGVRKGVAYYRNEACEDNPASPREWRRIMERSTRLALQRWGPVLSGRVTGRGVASVYGSDVDLYKKEIEDL